MNNSPSPSWLGRLQRRLRARLARPQTLFLGIDGVQSAALSRPEAWADWCRAHAGSAVRLSLSSRLLHELVCQPGLPLDDEAALLAYARQQFGQYFGAAAKPWSLAGWRLEAEPQAGLGEQCGAIALHGSAAQGWREVAAEHGVRLTQVQPAWALALQRLAQDEPEWRSAEHAALAWLEGQVLTWLTLTSGHLAGLRQLRLREATPEALAELLQELLQEAQPGLPAAQVHVMGYGLQGAGTALNLGPALRLHGRLDATAPDLAQLEPGDAAPSRRLPRPDFLGAPRERSPLAWPLAATAALVLSTAGWSAWQAYTDRLQQQTQLARLKVTQAAAPRAKPQTTPVAAVAVPARGRDAGKTAPDASRPAQEVQALLRQPWEALLVQVEQAGAALKPAPLAWLSMDVNGPRQELRLEGLASDKLLPLQLVDRLAAEAGWRDVMLSRLQNAEQGLTGQRFELTAKFRGDLLRRPGVAAAEAADAPVSTKTGEARR
ncbi:MAG: hypothetical protein O9341_12620 [Paucibacter sp.]|nr:hypothetical protein [Roseateles sp.]